MQLEVVQTLDILTECLDMLSKDMSGGSYSHNDALPIQQKLAAARRHIKKIKKMEE
jgi:hypothetical protein